jgi:hypothetical protein
MITALHEAIVIKKSQYHEAEGSHDGQILQKQSSFKLLNRVDNKYKHTATRHTYAATGHIICAVSQVTGEGEAQLVCGLSSFDAIPVSLYRSENVVDSKTPSLLSLLAAFQPEENSYISANASFHVNRQERRDAAKTARSDRMRYSIPYQA